MQLVVSLTLPIGLFLRAFLLSADFFQDQLFQKTFSGISSERQTVRIQIGPDISSGLAGLTILFS